MKTVPYQVKGSLYHSFLRVAAAVFALLLIFDSGLFNRQTALLSALTQWQMAQLVGVSVGVAPNEVNQLTARITELQTELDAKERLIAVNVAERQSTTPTNSTFILSAILFILLVLIVINYVLDYLRSQKEVVYVKKEIPIS